MVPVIPPASSRPSAGMWRQGSIGCYPRVTAADLFGPPVEVGDRVLLTAATVQRAGGFGFGGGVGRVGSEAGAGGGGGGGGGIEGRPVAVIEVGPHGVTVRPIVDLTRLTIALLAALVAWRRAVRRMVG